MKNLLTPSVITIAIAGLPAAAQNTPSLPTATPIRGAHYPALSADSKRLAFEYHGDIWTADAQGGAAKRLTVHQSYDSNPHWSPDGNWIAFTSNREGNQDVFIMPSRGGEARQLTFHSASDSVLDWSPDGTKLLFVLNRAGRYADLFTLGVKDHALRRLTNDQTSSIYGSFSPSGKTVVYSRGGQSWWRPKYRGSRNNDLYLVSAEGGKANRLTKSDCWNAWPLFGQDEKSLLFVRHERDNSNIFRMNLSTNRTEQITNHTGDPVRFASISRDGSRVAYEQNFQIWVMNTNPAPGAPLASATVKTPLSLYAPADQLENNVQPVRLNAGAGTMALSQDAKTVAFTARGEIWTVPSGGGDATRMTSTQAQEYAPVWSTDGNTLAYTSSRAGALNVFLMDVKSKKEVQLTTGAADDGNVQFSENGAFLSFVRSGGSEPGLYVVPLPKDFAVAGEKKTATVGPTRIAAGTGISSYDWSPDGRWVVFAKRDATSTTDLWIVPAVGGTPVNVTRYPGFNGSPQWSRDGRNIVFVSNRGSEPGATGVNIYVLPLLSSSGPDGGAGPRPGTRVDGDEETLPPNADPQTPDFQRRQRPAPATPQTPQQGPAGPSLPAFGVPPLATNVRIEFEDIHNRARAVTNTRDPIGSVTLAPDTRSVFFTSISGGQPGWFVVDLASGQSARITMGAVGAGIQFASDNSRFFFLTAAGTILTLARGSGEPTPVPFSANLQEDRFAVMGEAFNEAWRSLRTQFYDPKMHGTDWEALRSKYEPILKETMAKEDFAWLLQAMIGELNASHLGATPPAEPGPGTSTGLLGLTFDQNFAGPGLKVVDVLPKGPSDRRGSQVFAGEYILEIDGEKVAYNEELYKALRDKAGREVELLVAQTPPKDEKPAPDETRIVKVRPIAQAAITALEYDRWVESRRRKVDALSGGRLGYAHIQSMDQPSLQKFQRELFGDLQGKQGLVLDVRFNGGGRIHDELFALLNRKPHAVEVPRDGERATQPFQVWNRPSILLINEYSASDAEIFPNGFKYYGLGKLVGVPTYGAVIGTVNITLIDGTTFRIPRTGWYTMDGKPLENVGVAPDILVEHSPEDNATDNDRQLEAAVKSLLGELKIAK